LIEIINEYFWDEHYLSKNKKWSKDEINFFQEMVIEVFRDINLYKDFEINLKDRFKRFRSRFPNIIEEQNIMAGLTSFDYIRDNVNILPITLKDTNKKLVDILNYDSYL
jgi:hypothetical protein